MKKVAVIIVDMQDFFLKGFPEGKVQELVSNQNKVISFCIKSKIPIFVLEYAKRGETTKPLKSNLKKVSDTAIVKKENNSGFRNTNLHELLQELKVKNIVLMGINASGCVQDTAIGAVKRGYKIITARGVIASNTKKDANLNTSKKWYSKNGKFLDGFEQLMVYVSNLI
jgi:nicotinamidase-related amidase